MIHQEKIRRRYYVTKSSGIFSKALKILEIFDSNFTLIRPDYLKGSKNTEIYNFDTITEITISDRNNNDINVKYDKKSFILTYNDRIELITDLLYYKVLYNTIYRMYGILNLNTPPALPWSKGFIYISPHIA